VGRVNFGNIEGVLLTPLTIIPGELGNVLHAMTNSSAGFGGFGEAYFSTVTQGKIKGWKKHTRMTLNLVVPAGNVTFVLYDDRKESRTFGTFFKTGLSPESYRRLTVPPHIWFAFQGDGEPLNLVLNIADLPHDPQEIESLPINDPKFSADVWK